jgi:hypothetical protein
VSADASLLAEVPGFDLNSAKALLTKAQGIIDQGLANQPIPESVTKPFKKNKKGPGKDDSSSDEGKDISSVEEKLRAELAAREKGKTESEIKS